MEHAPVTAASRNTQPIRTGVTSFCSMNTSTARPGAAWGRAIKRAGPRWQLNYWRTQSMILIEKKSTSTVLANHQEFVTRLAQTQSDVSRAQRLRFEVFNLELNEGLAESHFIGLDADPFDAVCDHLIVEHVPSRQVVGTYRL